jgi:hypothetical protein
MKNPACIFLRNSTMSGLALRLFAVAIPSVGCALAQDFLPVQIGLKGGMPLSNTFSTSGAGGLKFSSADRRYIVGATGEFRIFGPVSFEVDTLFRRVGFDYSGPDIDGVSTLRRSTVANWWEFPGLFKVKLGKGTVRPFVDVGASLRHISSIRETTYTVANFAPIINDNSVVLNHRNSFGGVAGVGANLVYKKLRFSPEARYTRWANEAFYSGSGLLHTNKDQVDFLVGFTF